MFKESMRGMDVSELFYDDGDGRTESLTIASRFTAGPFHKGFVISLPVSDFERINQIFLDENDHAYPDLKAFVVSVVFELLCQGNIPFPFGGNDGGHADSFFGNS